MCQSGQSTASYKKFVLSLTIYLCSTVSVYVQKLYKYMYVVEFGLKCYRWGWELGIVIFVLFKSQFQMFLEKLDINLFIYCKSVTEMN